METREFKPRLSDDETTAEPVERLTEIDEKAFLLKWFFEGAENVSD